jgi:hypothetical protein
MDKEQSNKLADDIHDSAVKIAGRALDAMQDGDSAKAKFLAENAAMARFIAKRLRK